MNKIQLNNEQRQNKHIKDETSNSKDESESNTSNEIEENDLNDNISQDFLNKKIIDLSFLDVINDDNVEFQTKQNTIKLLIEQRSSYFKK